MCWSKEPLSEREEQETEVELPRVQIGQDDNPVVPVPDFEREEDRDRELTLV